MSISFSKLFSSAAAAPLFLETSVVAIETHHQIVRLFTEEVGYSILCGVDCYSRSEESVSDKCGVCFVCVCMCVCVCGKDKDRPLFAQSESAVSDPHSAVRWAEITGCLNPVIVLNPTSDSDINLPTTVCRLSVHMCARAQGSGCSYVSVFPIFGNQVRKDRKHWSHFPGKSHLWCTVCDITKRFLRGHAEASSSGSWSL